MQNRRQTLQAHRGGFQLGRGNTGRPCATSRRMGTTPSDPNGASPHMHARATVKRKRAANEEASNLESSAPSPCRISNALSSPPPASFLLPTSAVLVEGGRFFRWHLTLSTLSTKPVVLRFGRTMNPLEVNFLRLLGTITVGSEMRVEVESTGKGGKAGKAHVLHYKPGVIGGGTSLTHRCCSGHLARSVSYWLEPLAVLLPFARGATELTLQDVLTNGRPDTDMSADSFRTLVLPLLEQFGVSGCTLRIVRRAYPPVGDGVVVFSVPNPVRTLSSFDHTEFPSKVQRIRGIAHGHRVHPDLLNRMATSAKGALLRLLPDIYVVTDLQQTSRGGSRPPESEPAAGSSGYGMLLTTQDVRKRVVSTAEVVIYSGAGSGEHGGGSASSPDETDPDGMGIRCAHLLLDHVLLGGSLPRVLEPLVVLLMALAPDTLQRVRFSGKGRETDQSESTESQNCSPLPLRSVTAGMMFLLIRHYLGVAFVVEDSTRSPYWTATAAATRLDKDVHKKKIVCGGGEVSPRVVGSPPSLDYTTYVVSCIGMRYVNLSKRSG